MAFGSNVLHSRVRQRPPKGEGNIARMLPFAASRAAAFIRLVPVCASYEGRSRALFCDTATRVTGRSDGRDREVWMGCRASLTAAVLDVRRMGMRCGRGPQIAIPPSRPATPRALTRLSVPLPFYQSDPYALRGGLPYVSLEVTLGFPNALNQGVGLRDKSTDIRKQRSNHE